MPLEELATRLSVATAEVEGIERIGVDDAGGNLDLFRVGTRARGREAPERRPAAGHEGRRRRARAARRSSAARGTSASAPPSASRCPGAVLPNGLHARAARGSRRGLRRDDPGRGRGRPRHRAQRDHAAGRGRARARRSPTCCRSPTRCCSSSRPATAPTCSRSTAWRARSRRSTTCRPRTLSAGPRRRIVPERSGGDRASTTSRAARATSGGCSRASTIGPSPMWLRARLNAAGPAPDLERRRHHQLRDARPRQPAARVRPPEARRRADRRPPRRGRASGCARSTASTASSWPTTS